MYKYFKQHNINPKVPIPLLRGKGPMIQIPGYTLKGIKSRIKNKTQAPISKSQEPR
jgi:hypothetical protein